jgi:hypothetical protein
MTAYNIVNASSAALTDVNAGGTDVPAYSCLDGVTLTTTELAAVLANAAVAVTKTAPSSSNVHWISKVLRIGSNPGA